MRANGLVLGIAPTSKHRRHGRRTPRGAPGGAAGTGAYPGVGGWAGSPPENILGDTCASDSECQYMICVEPLTVGGGVAHGMCTFECQNDPSFCGKAVPGSSCEPIGGSMYCVSGCELGPVTLTSFDPKKCGGRTDFACSLLSAGSHGCLPNCNGDFECPNGTVCNPKTGLCQVGAVSGAPIGSACSDDSTCKGQCLEELGLPICSEPCTIGALPSCGWGGPGTGPASAACVFLAEATSDAGIGDRGLCDSLCDSDAGCPSGLGCTIFPDAAVASFFGKKGYCSP